MSESRPGRLQRSGRIAALMLLLAASAEAETAAADEALEPQRAVFSHLNVHGGMSQASVLTMAEDASGFLWLGTQDGLNRYDGDRVTVYRRDLDSAHGLASSRVDALLNDRQGRLWIGTSQGLHRYLPAWNRFERAWPASAAAATVLADAIAVLKQDREGALWVGGRGLATRNTDDGRWRALDHGAHGQGELPGQRVLALAEAADGGWWVGTNAGLAWVDGHRLQAQPRPLFAEPQPAINALLLDRLQRLWIGTSGSGLFRLDPDGRLHAIAAVTESRILALLQDRQDRLWVGHETGLDLRLPTGSDNAADWRRFRHHPHHRSGLGSGRIASLFEASDGTLWVGSWTGGAGRLHPDGPAFLAIHPDTPAGAVLRDSSVQAVCRDADDADSAYLGTRDGLFRLHRPSLQLRSIDASRGIDIGALWCDAEGPWAGGSSGLYRWSQGRWLEMQPDPAVGKPRIRSIFRDAERLWLGTEADLYLLELPELRLRARVAIGGWIKLLAPYDDNLLLTGGNDGLQWLDRRSAEVRHVHRARPGEPGALQSNAPTAYLHSRRGERWLGTQGGGLHRLRVAADGGPQAVGFDLLDSSDGLAADAIGGLLEDASGRLWISTTRGLTRLDLSDGTVRNFTAAEGVSAFGYYIASQTELADGYFVFGGLEGVTLFAPERLRPAPLPPPPSLTEVEIDGRPWRPLESVLRWPARQLRSLRLQFTSPYFYAPADLLLSYRLQGYDDDWQELPSGWRSASYTNLAPGHYRFQVRAGNRDGRLHPTMAELTLELLPAWWQTVPARVGGLLLLLAGLFSGYRWRVGGLARQRARLARQVAERTAEVLKLGAIGRELTATLDADQAMQRVHHHIDGVLDAHTLSIWLLDRDGQRLQRGYGVEQGERLPPRTLPLDDLQRPAVWCVVNQRELIALDAEQQASYLGAVPTTLVGQDTQSLVFLPLRVESRVIGCLTVQSLRPQAYSESQIELLRVLASYTAIALDHAQALAQLRESHQQLLDAQQQLVLQEKLAALGTLTAGIAHEINNPTNFAQAAVQQLEEEHRRLHQFISDLAGADADADVLAAFRDRFERLTQMTATAHEGHRRIAAIVRDLRQFSRLDEAERKRIHISEPIRSTVNLIRTRFDRISFVLDLHVDPEIDCQPAKLGQAFMNLIVNACEAASEHHGAVGGSVRVVSFIDGAALIIDVVDNGAGMDAATQARIFDPFFTTKGIGAGTGLGLPITLGIIREHGGEISVESSPGHGSRFRLRLPLPAGSVGSADVAVGVAVATVKR